MLLQDLEEEGQVMLVGAEGARWVLTQHAEPWLLTIKTSQWTRVSPDAFPFLDNKHVIPFMRKRRPGLREDSEETPAKRAALDTHQDQDGPDTEQSETQQESEQRPEQLKGAEEDNSEQKNEPEGQMNTQPEKEKKEEEKHERRLRKPTQSCKNSCCASPTLKDVTHE